MTTSKIIPLAILCVGLSGCASTPDLSFMKMPSINLSSDSAENSAQTFEQITEQYEKWERVMANSGEMKNYAPKSYQSLLGQWADVQEVYSEIQTKPEIIDEKTSLISFNTYGDKFNDSITTLSKAYTDLNTTIEQAKTIIPEAITEHTFLLENDLNTKSPAEFKIIESKYQDLFDYISQDKLDKAKEYQTRYLDSAFKFEVNTAKTAYAVTLSEKLAEDKGKGMDQSAPQTFLVTEDAVQSVYDEIEKNPRNISKIKSLVTNAEFNLAHLEQVATQVQLLASITEGQYEPTVLEIEKKLLALSKEVDGSDFRDTLLTNQIDKILKSVKGLQDKISSLESNQAAE